MLVLSRKSGESIIIGNDIEIKILEIEDGKIKLGIDAPRDIEIYRKELYVAIEEENKAASKQQLNIEDLKKIFMSQEK